jgi:hypothetical protein
MQSVFVERLNMGRWLRNEHFTIRMMMLLPILAQHGAGMEILNYEGATSDKDERANIAAIASAEGSIVQRSKDLGAGCYLPAYEDYYNMSTGDATWGNIAGSPLNGLAGANLLVITAEDLFHYSFTELYDNGGRYSSSSSDDNNKLVIVVSKTGD